MGAKNLTRINQNTIFTKSLYRVYTEKLHIFTPFANIIDTKTLYISITGVYAAKFFFIPSFSGINVGTKVHFFPIAPYHWKGDNLGGFSCLAGV